MIINETHVDDTQLMADNGLENEGELIIFKMIAGIPLTQEETGKILGVTKMGVCKIERRALGKLKSALATMGIKSSDDVFEPKFRGCASDVSASGCEVYAPVV